MARPRPVLLSKEVEEVREEVVEVAFLVPMPGEAEVRGWAETRRKHGVHLYSAL